MENVIKFKKCITDFKVLEDSECEKGVKISVYSETYDLIVYNNNKEDMKDSTIFGINIECGEKSLMLDVTIGELELFASSILNHIKIIREQFAEQIKNQYDNHCNV